MDVYGYLKENVTRLPILFLITRIGLLNHLSPTIFCRFNPAPEQVNATPPETKPTQGLIFFYVIFFFFT